MSKDKELEPLKEKIINITLLTGALSGVLLYLLSLINYRYIGFRISFIIDFTVIIILLFIAFYRKKLPLKLKSIIVISILFLLFISDTLELGANSENRMFIILIPFYTFLIYSLRKVIYVYLLAIFIFIGIGFLFHIGYIQLHINLNYRNLVFNTWIINAITITIISSAVVLIMARFQDEYKLLINNLQENNKKLTEQELYYREIFNSTSNAIFIYSLDGELLDINDTMIKMYGYSSREEVLNTDVWNFSNGSKKEVKEIRKKHFQELIKNKHLSFDWEAQKKDGTVFWINVDAKRIKIGQEERILSVVKDITKQKEDEIQLNLYRNHLKELIAERTKQLEQANEELKVSNETLEQQKEEIKAAFEELKNMQEQLIQSEKMASLGLLAAGVAHEINNPLNFIQGGIFGIESYFEQNLSDHYNEIKPLFEGIVEGVRRASEIVTSLNNYSRSDISQKEPCDIHEIIDNSLIMLKSKIKKGINISKNYTKKTFILIGNEGKLHQVMVNVLLNAIQAIKNEGEINIITEIDNNFLYIRVIDSGEGISKQDINKIFDPFFTTKEIGEGTGLGMSISAQIIKDHDGDITYKSEKGKGTEVIIKLPVNDIKKNKYNN